MFGTATEVSAVIAIVSFLLTVVLIPTLLRKESYVPRFSSGATAIGMALFGICFADLSLWLAAVSELAGAVVWAAIYFWRGNRKTLNTPEPNREQVVLGDTRE